MVKKTKSCPYCRSDAVKYLKTPLKIFYLCPECNLVFNSKPEAYDKVLGIYQKEYYSNFSIDQKNGCRENLFIYILNQIEEKISIGKLLDVGTGCGNFLLAAQNRGWKVKGIEPSIQSAEIACHQYGLDVFNGTLRNFSRHDKFNTITFNNVLEHSVEPWKEIERASKLLYPGGLIYIRFPNGNLHTKIFRYATTCGVVHHIYKYLVFHQLPLAPAYIQRLLSDQNFFDIRFDNSPPSRGDPNGLFAHPLLSKAIKESIYAIANGIKIISMKKILMGTSLEVTALKKIAEYSEHETAQMPKSSL